ncbi:MAG: TetR family transcriptional regulator [Acidimicrobiales bacterium]|nr:TetR family transcriptional regulator [Acidimicrobiales bacterium]
MIVVPPLNPDKRRPPLRTSAKAIATRASLVELAAELFATRGYLETSIRDIARAAELTTGAIYGHFRNKADLLAEAISSRTVTDLESLSLDITGQATTSEEPLHVETLRRLSSRYPDRRQLRALILQGAAAALNDEETRHRLRDEQLSHLQVWIDSYEEHRSELGIDPSVDIREAVLYTWAAEVGLGVMEAVGIEPRTKRGWADMAARFGRGLNLPDQPGRAGKR